ncbi:PAS domain S-box protein [Pelagibius sp. CAU 1746]|uniref:PAS domain S-box protein n=1 Tax=Pelagibius sp. CAU 1746 TaxID=3140370 RepID=UPI00325B91B1
MSAPKSETRRQEPQSPVETDPDLLALMAARLPAVFYRGRLEAEGLRLERVSGRAEEITGYDAERLCAEDAPFEALIHPDDRPVYRRALSRAAAEGGAGLDYRLRKPDGTVLRCRDEIAVRDGAVTGMLLNLGDARREEMEEDEILRQRHGIIERASHPIVLSDAQGNITACNRAAQSLFGTACEEVAGQDFANLLLAPESRADYRDTVAGLLAQPGEDAAPGALSLTARRRDGSLLPVEVMASVITLAGARNVVTELHDISQRINAEEELERVWRLLRDAVDNIPNGFAIYGEDQRLILCNASYASLYDASPEDMVGSSTLDNYLRGRAKMKVFDGRPVDSGEDGEEDSLWLDKVIAAEKEPVEFQLHDGTWLQTSTHPIHGGGRVYVRTDITKLKRIEESLRQSEQKFRVLVENNPLPLWLTDTYSGEVLYHSPAAAELLGYSWPITELYHSERSFASPEEREACTNELIEKGRLDGRVTRLKKADGSEFWGAVSARLAKIGDRAFSIGTVVDLTGQMAKEAELREARETLHDAVESLSEGFALYDAKDRLVMCNQRYRDFNFMSAEALTPGVPWIDFIRSGAERGQYVGAEGRVEEWLEERKKLRQQFSTEMEFQQADGRWFQFSNQPTRQGGIVVTRTDVTNRKEMERALRESESLVRSILESSPVPVAMVRAEDGLVIYESPASRRVFGQMQTSGEPSYIRDLYVNPEDRLRYLELLRSQGTVEGFEVQLRRADGEVIWVSLTASLIEYQGEEMIVASAHDLTERRAVEEQMTRQREALYQSEKLSALGALLAGVAHELNNPLSVVVGHAQLMKETAEDPRTVQRAEKIGNAADRCSRIVKSFLAMARQRPPERRAVDLRDIVQATLDVTGYSLRTANIEVEMDIGAAVPPVWADSDQLNQVVTNIIVNAQQAMMEVQGPRILTIKGTYDTKHDEVRLNLADTGPGIPEEIRSRIFEPFFTTKDIGEGTGVGLAVSHRVIEAHDGRIRVDSTPGKGAAFTLVLPASTQAREAPAETPAAAADSPKARILIIDDEPEVLQTLAEILTAQGHDVMTADSGMRALGLIEGYSFDVILSDVRMPKLDGPSLYAALERKDPSLLRRTAFVSGDTLSPSARVFLQRVQRPFIEKPFNLDEVRGLIAQILAQQPRAASHGAP